MTTRGPATSTSSTAPTSATSQPRLTLCMIVRDSVRTLDACLTSIRPWVDEMVVVDTGSTDETPQLAARHGARVFHFPWCDDFAAARNESLRHANGTWLFWMDSDDTIDETNGRKLRQLADQPLPSAPMGYVMQVHCPGPEVDGCSSFTSVDHVKMFRNRSDLRFEGRIHEQILGGIRRVGGAVVWTDLFIVHSGSDQSSEGRERKHERDLRLLQLELVDHPEHPFALFNLGMTYGDMGDHQRAIQFLTRALEVAAPDESHVRKAYALLISSQTQTGEYQSAWQTCQKGRYLFAKDSELLFREGIVAHHLGQLSDAVKAYQAVLHQVDDRHFSSVDPAITGYKARHNLALVYADLGQLNLAELQWRQVIAEVPTNRAGWRGLCDVLLRQRKLVTAEIEAERLLSQPNLSCQARLMFASVARHRGQWDAVRRELELAMTESPEDLEVLQARCEFLFQHGDLHETEEALLRLCTLLPTDGAAFHNLGTVYFQRGRMADAVDAYRESLRVRPHSPQTQLQLEQALVAMGRS
jgi:tetratricopeptide (TPR) repeat protein